VISASTFDHLEGSSTSRIFVHVLDSTKLTGNEYKVTFDVESEYNASATITNASTSTTVVENFPIDKGEGVFYLTDNFDGVAVQIVPVFDFKLDYDNSYFANNSGSNITFTVAQGLGSSKLAPIDFIVVWGDTETLEDGSYANPLDSAYNQTGQKVVMCPFYAWNLTDKEKMDLVVIEPNITDNRKWDPSEAVGFLTPPQYQPNNIQYHASLIPFHAGGTAPLLPTVGDTNYIFTRRPLTSEDEFTFVTDKAYLTTDLIEDNLPVKFDLMQNYPNPFNPSTTIEYTIPSTNSPLLGGAGGGLIAVQLKIYNILGQEVTTLVDRPQSPGQYRVLFNASGLASGVYFYNIRMKNKTISRKMLFVK